MIQSRADERRPDDDGSAWSSVTTGCPLMQPSLPTTGSCPGCRRRPPSVSSPECRRPPFQCVRRRSGRPPSPVRKRGPGRRVARPSQRWTGDIPNLCPKLSGSCGGERDTRSQDGEAHSRRGARHAGLAREAGIGAVGGRRAIGEYTRVQAGVGQAVLPLACPIGAVGRECGRLGGIDGQSQRTCDVNLTADVPGRRDELADRGGPGRRTRNRRNDRRCGSGRGEVR